MTNNIKTRITDGQSEGFLTVGEVEVKVDLSSLIKTDDAIKALDLETIDRLAEMYGISVGLGQPSHAKRVLVRSHVQNDWYMTTKGAIPMSVQKNHQKREETISKDVTATADPGAPKAPRQRKAVVPGKFMIAANLDDQKQADLSKIRGQAKHVVDALREANGEAKSPAELAAVITAKGAYPSKHEDVPGSVLYHLKGLQSRGFVTQLPAEPAAE